MLAILAAPVWAGGQAESISSGPESLSSALRNFSPESSERRITAMRKIGELGPQASVPEILHGLESAAFSPFVKQEERLAAVETLEQIHTPASAKAAYRIATRLPLYGNPRTGIIGDIFTHVPVIEQSINSLENMGDIGRPSLQRMASHWFVSRFIGKARRKAAIEALQRMSDASLEAHELKW